LGVAAALLIGVVAALVGVSSAAPKNGLSADVVRALKNVERTGEISAKDRAVLMTNRTIAAQLVDPSKTQVIDESEEGPELMAAAAGATAGTAAVKAGCHRADRYISYRTLLGAKAFDWHKVLHYCWDKKGKVTVKERRYYIANNDGLNFDRGLISNTQTGKGTTSYASTMQGKVENCVTKFGCIKVNNPYIRIAVNGKKGLPYKIWQRK
jgi:hypothetical protein